MTCDIFVTDGRRPTHCHYCGHPKTAHEARRRKERWAHRRHIAGTMAAGALITLATLMTMLALGGATVNWPWK